MKIKVLYEDNHLLAVSKPPGVLVHGDKTGDDSLLDQAKDYLKREYNKPGQVFLGLTHRLDRPASGVVIFARTSKALTRMNQLIKERRVSKSYLAISNSQSMVTSGILKNFLSKDRRKNVVSVFDKPAQDRKLAELEYTVKAKLGGFQLFSIHLITGRSHQIRAQLAHIQCPIVGDLKYGYPTALPDKSIALHCHSMEFIHPVKKELIRFETSPPSSHPWKIFGEFFR